MKQTMSEALVFVVLACGVGLVVNAQRSDGLDLTRNYFPAPNSAPISGVQIPAGRGSPDRQLARGEPLEHGFQTVSLSEAWEYYQRGDSSIVFVDTRNDEHYQKCHVPQAIQFDYYHPERCLPEVLDFAADADVVILYCNGGTCEDSLLAARYLTEEIDQPLMFENVYVFEGGIQAWHKAGYEREPEDCEP